MSNLASVLKEEIARIARKEVKPELVALKQESIRLRKKIREMQVQLDALSRQSKKVVKKVTAVVGEEAAVEEAPEARIRPTDKTIKTLRTKFKMTQAEFGLLLGVSMQSVTNWERTEGRLNLRNATLARLQEIMKMGKKEAVAQLESMGAKKAKTKKKK